MTLLSCDITPDERKVLADIRLAMPKGYRVVGYGYGWTGDPWLGNPGSVSVLTEPSGYMHILLAPIAPEAKPCRCGSPVRVRSTDNKIWCCECSAVASCCYRSPGQSTAEAAVKIHNAMMETADAR
jgi:hypothetical protein